MNNVNISLNSVQCNEEMDAIDELFTRSFHVDPPADIVNRIMQAVSHLPQPRPLSQWKDYDFFMVECDIEHFS